MDLKWQLALLSMRARKYYQRIGKKITINGSDTAGYDKSNVECFNCHKMGYFARECRGPRNQEGRPRNQDSSRRTVNVEDTSSKAMVIIDGAALKTQLDNLRVEFNKSEFNLAIYKRGLAYVEEQLVFYKKNEVMLCDQIVVLKRDTSFKASEINALKIEIEKLKKEKESNQIKINKFENASKSLDKLIGSQISDNSRKGVGYNPEFEGYGPMASKSVCVDTSTEVKKTHATPLVEELEKEKQTVFPTKIEFVKQQDKTARKPVKYAEMYRSQKPRGNQRNWNNLKSQQLGSNFVMYNKACFVCGSFDHVQAHCKYLQRERMVYGNNYNRVNYNYTINIPHPNAQRNMVPRAVLMKNGLKPFNTVRLVNTAHPKSTVNSAKPMAFHQLMIKAMWTVDAPGTWHATFPISQISKSLIEDMLPLEEESDKEKSLVKLPDESQILLKIPRKNNMYSVDMKNIVPKESLIYLVAKATLDKSMLWHRRLGHINFKTINKLVKDNLVRGLPSKHFENDQTCVACLKGKQHKASCKSKGQNSITQPLFMLHMDLFGLTFVSSLMNKKYCLVVTDDYSRFTWVFFLASKDETSGILKNFITKIENLVDKKVKIIRCDNGIEFKNRVMNEFCEQKGIKREYSIARTPP
ncbi:putative ribonuclease H-like domain-containing protein [Tanacetum coccineum]